MKNTWKPVAAARRGFADLVEGLDEQQREGTTLCAGWTPHHLLAHVTTFVEVPLPKFLFNMGRAGFDSDAASDRMARALAEHPVDELAAILRAKAEKKSVIPGFPAELSLSDVTIHTQDVRRGLGLEGAPGEGTVRSVLDFLTHQKQARLLCDTSRLQGLAFRATDIDWHYGNVGGAVPISGPSEALMMGIAGRDIFDELSGPVDKLR
ncbi:MAG: maleylpyruvate isomerase family mycothiol-dependent enzyme [Acidimicrobiia bacterium]|nr:maleylpyruvate isomerase family mycothiol-dependent enzyme [Acidimicrobiia bacterium]